MLTCLHFSSLQHFVSERKYDEDLGRVARFTCDLDALKKSIESFGQVSHPKNSYSTRSRCSSMTSMAVSSPDESTTTACASTSSPSLIMANKKPSSPIETSTNATSRPSQFHREGFQGNRRFGQGYRSQGQRQNGSSHHNSNRYRNGSWYQSNYKSRPPSGNSNNLNQTCPAGINGTRPGPEPGLPAPSLQTHLVPLSPEAKALPQRKPRSSQYEASNS
uniref:Uncharacterized protein n=1 Tax=Micrurus spixii TaxID=129469 RepID=A0A2D4MJS6_9SAUR